MNIDRDRFNKNVEKAMIDIRPMTEQETLEQRIKMLETLLQHREDQITGLKAHAEALNSECNELALSIMGALPWMILLGDYIGNGTKDDPMGRCNTILAMRKALGRDSDGLEETENVESGQEAIR